MRLEGTFLKGKFTVVNCADAESGTSSGILDRYSPELRDRALTAIVHGLRQL